jgi:uncharacterized repeat protein (TIGR02543 family)
MGKTLIILGALLLVILLMGACGPTQYTLTTSVSPSGGGTVTPASGIYDEGAEVTLIANPASGYRFDHWSGSATGTSNSISVTMDANKAVAAHFKAQYALSTSVIPSGSGTIAPASDTFDAGTNVTLTASPASGYAFDYWSGDATGTSNSVTITIDSEKSVTAHFKAVFVSDDGRIGFDLNEIERTQICPSDIEGDRSPKAGHDFVVVHITVAFIQEGYIDPTEMKYMLVDSNGVQYKDVAWNWTGVIFEDPLNLSGSAGLAEGTSAILLFELPLAVEATKLELTYNFSETWKAPQFEEGHVVINLK